ncbi:MAG: two-component system, cell cycle sensor histidine kinase and response regulator CckA [Myxococcales bacterium]|jgi:signal transduction histidine kinase/CheY-like chemotaxis protein|nr:two-component system, cell cycle sensor histidine kinase and response regulator CckA [Myxococcales bacterium]
MADLSTDRLLAFAKKLLPVSLFAELLSLARDEVESAIGYRHIWFMVRDEESHDELRLIDFSGDQRDIAWKVAPVLKISGDRFLQDVLQSDGPLVIPDARLDPRTNKEIVEKLQNRTMINIPLRVLDRSVGLFGVGTFGDEGCLVPERQQLDYLVGMASQIAIAAARLRHLEERQHAERERSDLERRLLQLQKLESLGMMAGGIAHDFNNLLTVILSSATMAEQATRDEDQLTDIRAIIEAAVRGRDLTRKLLAMSRQQALKLKPLDVNGRLTELLSLVRRMLPATIQIDLIPGTRLPLTEGDPAQLDQVFMNLCINARDAMPGGGRLTLETEQVLVNGKYAQTHPWAKPGRYVLTTVTDTGVGMPRDLLERIFDPFFTTKELHAGTGLGLSMSYGIVRQHGGMLHCYSEPGVGTSFKVYLPAAERLAVNVGTKLRGAVPRGTSGERILLAEDDPAVRAVAVRILQEGGYHVTAVDSGDAVLEIITRETFALLVTDVVMPGTPCSAVIDHLRQSHPDTGILLSSGYTAGVNLVDLMRQTGLELLRKPYDPDQLLFAVRRTLDHEVAVPSDGGDDHKDPNQGS